MLVVHLCKPAIYKLKILGGGEFEYYKSNGGTTKKVGEPNFGSPVEAKGGGGGHNFDSNLVGRKTLEETMLF